MTDAYDLRLFVEKILLIAKWASNVSTSEKVLHSTNEKVLIFNTLLKKDRLFKRSKRPLKLYYAVIYFLIVEISEKK